MTQEIAGSGNPEPGPDTFNFEDYLEGNATFPVFDHTAYLDQKSGAELGDVSDALEAGADERVALDEKIEQRRKQSGGAFVDPAMDALLERREELDGHLEELAQRHDELRGKVLKSGIVLTFQVKTAEELGVVSREATRQFHKENKQFQNATEDDLEFITARSRYALTAQISHFCSGMTLSDGRKVPPPTRVGADKLLRSLIASETMRLMESVGAGLSASREWAQKLDAGFPGGSADVEDVRLDKDGIEDGQSLGGPPLADANGAAVGLVGRTEQETSFSSDNSGGRDM